MSRVTMLWNERGYIRFGLDKSVLLCFISFKIEHADVFGTIDFLKDGEWCCGELG